MKVEEVEVTPRQKQTKLHPRKHTRLSWRSVYDSTSHSLSAWLGEREGVVLVDAADE